MRITLASPADVVSFVRGSWGNHANAVSRDDVGRVRKILAIEKTAR